MDLRKYCVFFGWLLQLEKNVCFSAVIWDVIQLEIQAYLAQALQNFL